MMKSGFQIIFFEVKDYIGTHGTCLNISLIDKDAQFFK